MRVVLTHYQQVREAEQGNLFTMVCLPPGGPPRLTIFINRGIAAAITILNQYLLEAGVLILAVLVFVALKIKCAKNANQRWMHAYSRQPKRIIVNIRFYIINLG